MLRGLIILLVTLSVLAGAPVTAENAEDAPPEFGVTVGADGAASDDAGGTLTVTEFAPGERVAWALNLTANYTVLDLRVEDAFDVERPKQVVPRLDGKHFVEVFTIDVTEVDHPAPVLRVSGDADAFTYRLGVPGPGVRNLTLHVDTDAPEFTISEVEKLTHRSFHVESTTTESALANLRWQPVDGGDAVDNPTPSPALLQRFPIQGLQADTEYTVRMTFEDWSGNVAEAAPFTVRTLPAPDLPKPLLTVYQPVGGEYAVHEVPEIRVLIESSESPVTREGVRFFFDKTELHENWTVADGVLRYDPGPLPPGYHSFSVEARTVAGGEAFAVGNFTVTGANTPAPGVAGVLLPLALLGVAAGALRRRPH